MNRATIALLALAPALVSSARQAAPQAVVPPMVPPPAAGPDQAENPPVDPLQRLLALRPRVVVWPMAALLDDGTSEQRLAARATWPGTDSAPDFALHLLAGLTSRHDVYSHSGFGLDAALRLGPARMTGAASAITGTGAGPRQAISFSFGTGIRSLTFELRSTWFQGAPIDTSRTPIDSEPLPFLPGVARTYDGRYTDGELHALHRLGPIRLRLTSGLRFGGDSLGPRRWLFGELDLPLWRRFGLLVASGVRPERADLAQPGGRFAQLALRMDMSSPGPTLAHAPRPDLLPAATAVLPLAPGRYLLRLYLPDAHRVELKGDITDWQVIALRRSTEYTGIWETTIEKPAGIYHVNIRVDGGNWTVPHGLAAVPDRFGGSTGVLNLPPTKEVHNAN